MQYQTKSVLSAYASVRVTSTSKTELMAVRIATATTPSASNPTERTTVQGMGRHALINIDFITLRIF